MQQTIRLKDTYKEQTADDFNESNIQWFYSTKGECIAMYNKKEHKIYIKDNRFRSYHKEVEAKFNCNRKVLI